MVTTADPDQGTTPPVPATMRAVRLHAPADPARLVEEWLPVPQPGPHEVLVRVHAAAITRGELSCPPIASPRSPHTSSRASSPGWAGRFRHSNRRARLRAEQLRS